MKTLHYSIIIGTIFLTFVLLTMSSNIYAYTCAVKAPSIPTQYYYLHSDSVFVGTVSSITNYTTHKFDVKFDVEKTWKGSQHPTITITTQGLVACGYSLVQGEKYLIFASGYPLDYLTWATKPLSSAQDDIALLDSSKFQVQANLNEELFKKLVNARDAISNLMGSNMSKMPISYLFVDDLNFTVNVGIADKKASLPSGAQEYKQKLEEIVGNVPIRVDYAEYSTALPEIIVQHPKLLSSPLQQFKSGIHTQDVKCKEGHVLIIKAKDYSPACVRETSISALMLHGWALGPLKGDMVYLMKTNSAGKIFVQYTPVRNYTDVQIHSRIYDGKTGYQIPPKNMEVTAIPDIVLRNSNTIVTYAITSHSTKGIYWLEVDTCQFIPIVVSIDSSQITSSDLQYIMSGWRCPSPSLQYHAIGFDGITPKYVKLEQ